MWFRDSWRTAVLPNPNTPVDLPRAGDAHVQDIVPRDVLLFKEVLGQGDQPVHYDHRLRSYAPRGPDAPRAEDKREGKYKRGQLASTARDTAGSCCTAGGGPRHLRVPKR